MVPNESFPDNLLAELVQGHVDVSADRLRFVRCPTGKFNTTYFVEGASEPLALRIAPPDDRSQMLFYEHRMMRQEPTIHARIQAETDVPIPAILAHDFSHERIDRDYLLMKRMPGIPISDHTGLSRSAFDNLLAEVGQALKHVHAICRDEYGLWQARTSKSLHFKIPFFPLAMFCTKITHTKSPLIPVKKHL